MTQNELSVLSATQFAIGLSQVIRVMPTAFQYAQSVKILSGAGTLEIVQPQLSGSSTAAGSAWGTGYPVGANEILNFDGPAVFYLAATGASMTVAMMIGRTSGATVL